MSEMPGPICAKRLLTSKLMMKARDNTSCRSLEANPSSVIRPTMNLAIEQLRNGWWRLSHRRIRTGSRAQTTGDSLDVDGRRNRRPSSPGPEPYFAQPWCGLVGVTPAGPSALVLSPMKLRRTLNTGPQPGL